MHMLTAKALALRFLVADKSCSLQRPKNVHFEPAGCAFMGAEVAKSVQNARLHQAEGLGGMRGSELLFDSVYSRMT